MIPGINPRTWKVPGIVRTPSPAKTKGVTKESGREGGGGGKDVGGALEKGVEGCKDAPIIDLVRRRPVKTHPTL
jgi:hypothetical protein